MAKDFDSSKFLVPGIVAVMGDVGTFFGILFGIIISSTGVLLPMGLMLIAGSVFWHYATGIMMLFLAWPNIPKAGLIKKIVIVLNPRFWLIMAVSIPFLPPLSIGIALAILLQNKIVNMLAEQALILGVAAATGGTGLVAEGAAVGGAAATEAGGAAAEAATTATEEITEEIAKEAAEETFKEGAKRKGKEFAKKKLKEGLEGGEKEEEGEEEPLSPEDQELEDIMGGDPLGQHLMRAMSAEDILATIGEEKAPSRFDPNEMGPEMETKKSPSGTARGGQGIIDDKEIDLRNRRNREIL